MSIYSTRKGLKGSIIYTLNNRACKTADVPSNVVDLLKTQTEVNDENITLTTPYKKCIVDGVETKLSRQANGQTLYVCEEHYHNLTLGQLVQQARLNKEPVHEEVNGENQD